ncbi:MAG: 3-keto-5-aminohexanoate cleavage protein [Anaerolineales bacterium]
MEKVIITVALVGSRPTKDLNPAVPYSPEEIANSALDAWRAGAAIAHIHVRDPKTGEPSHQLELFQEVVERVRSESDILLNLTTSGQFIQGDDMEMIEKRLAPMSLHPEICSFDVGSLNFQDRIFTNPPAWGLDAAARMQAAGVKPEIEVFDTGHIAQAVDLIDKGLIDEPPWFQLCMGVKWGIPGTIENLEFMAKQLPDKARWSALGVGRLQDTIISKAIQMGGHIRVGLEDNLYLKKGVLAQSNAQFVEKAVSLVHEFGRQVAAPDEAREILKIKKHA